MIEIIYKNSNIENTENGTLKLPKNIRQIGSGDSDYQIYMEDYLMSYLKKRPEREGEIRYGVLLGDVKVGNGYTYFFINGAVDVNEVMENTIIFNDDVWTTLYEDINTYFIGNRIVGWFAALNENSNNDMMNIKKIHLDHFAGLDKVFLKLDMDEDEEAFYVYENTGLTKQPCYHIYYNKSENMEDYVFGTGKKDKFKRPEVKNSETGKYGILLNNLNEKKAKENQLEEKEKQQPEQKVDDFVSGLAKNKAFGRVAFVAAAVVIAGSVGAMQKDGKFNTLKEDVINFASGLIDDGEDETLENVISVNGIVGSNVPSSSAEETSETSTESSAQTTTPSESESTSVVAKEEETTPISVEPEPAKKDIYIVKEGDTLLSICIDYYSDKSMLDDVIAANGIENPDVVIPGDELIMP